MQKNKKKLSILVPLYNEEDCIELFFERINKVIKKIVSEYDISLYFLNNCSNFPLQTLSNHKKHNLAKNQVSTIIFGRVH